MAFECISRDWDRISKIRARHGTRIYLLYNCISLLLCLGEACEHQVGAAKNPTMSPGPTPYSMLIANANANANANSNANANANATANANANAILVAPLVKI